MQTNLLLTHSTNMKLMRKLAIHKVKAYTSELDTHQFHKHITSSWANYAGAIWSNVIAPAHRLKK